MTYAIGKLPLEILIGPLARATEASVRLDERLARSPVRDGFLERAHFQDAAAALWLEGELVHLEDLVLHDAHMNIRAPTHELTRAHAVLRTRRQISANPPDWALGRDGLRQLVGRGGVPAQGDRDGEGNSESSRRDGKGSRTNGGDSLADAFAAIDAVLERSNKVLDGGHVAPNGKAARVTGRQSGSDLVYDPDWNEDARLEEWKSVLAETRSLPAVLRAMVLLEVWAEIEVLQHGGWLGPLLVAAMLRQDGLAANHLACLHLGAKLVPRERRRARTRMERLLALLDAVREAALAGLKEHDRLTLARERLERRLKQRRASSKLPDLVELVLARPLVSTGMIQGRLKVSKQGALNLVGELGLREMTGRGRYRAWGIV